MEELVDITLPYVIKNYTNICTCSKCIDDIKALALNNLPTYYIATDKGRLFTKSKLLCNQFKADVLRELVAAIKTVSENPRH